MPDWLILLSTLGGLTTFGISGFVIGPILAALFLSVWTMFGEEQEARDEAKAGATPTAEEAAAAAGRAEAAATASTDGAEATAARATPTDAPDGEAGPVGA